MINSRRGICNFVVMSSQQHLDYYEPLPLYNLALESYGKYVSELGIALLKPTHRTTISLSKHEVDKRVRKAEQICNLLHAEICQKIPFRLASEVTIKLLIYIDNLYRTVHICCLNEPGCRPILQLLVNSVIHPSLTCLDLTLGWYFTVPMVYSRMFTMGNMRHLKLISVQDRSEEELIVKGVRVMVHLQTFSLHYRCTDRIIRAVCDCCRQLKVLDVRGSIKVSDASVGSILKLGYLEEVDVWGTTVSEAGYQQLVEGLKYTCRQLTRANRLLALLPCCLGLGHTEYVTRSPVTIVH